MTSRQQQIGEIVERLGNATEQQLGAILNFLSENPAQKQKNTPVGTSNNASVANGVKVYNNGNFVTTESAQYLRLEENLKLLVENFGDKKCYFVTQTTRFDLALDDNVERYPNHDIVVFRPTRLDSFMAGVPTKHKERTVHVVAVHPMNGTILKIPKR